MKTKLLLLMMGLAFTLNTKAYTSLYVQNPHKTWQSGQGTIDSVLLSIQPKGAYFEYGLYLTFSAKGLSSSYNKDSFEVQMMFDLPDGAIVHDSWLWVGNQIMQALIMDRGRANMIYEGIVKRRQDPSILYKNSATQYELRVYPMAYNETRKVKLTYLVPAQWGLSSVQAALPVNIIKASRTVPSLRIYAYTDSLWQQPRIPELPATAFSVSPGNPFMVAQVPSNSLISHTSLSCAMRSPMQNGIFASTYSTSPTDGYYQLVMMPSQVMNVNTSRKTALLFDYEPDMSYTTAQDVINRTRQMMHEYFSPGDSFNLILSHLYPTRISENWLPADSASIEAAFKLVTGFSTYSNLPSLMANGIDFLKKNGNNGELLLIANSDNLTSHTTANLLITDLLALMSPKKFPVNVLDYTEKNFSQVYLNNRYYKGNDYLYSNLTTLSGGNYERTIVNSNTYSSSIRPFSDAASAMFVGLDGKITNFDVYTKMQNGFCYGRYGPANQQIFQLNKTFIQVGRYYGNAPLEMEISGMYGGAPFSQNLSISQLHQADITSRKMWVGKFLQSLEFSNPDNEVIGQLIDSSIVNRVLSRYTAFLALEPNDTLSHCEECQDETNYNPGGTTTVGLNDEVADSVNMKAFPNPFTSQVSITIETVAVEGEVTLQIFNIMGQLVKNIPVDLSSGRKFEFIWGGDNNQGERVSSGIYLLTLSTPQGKQTLKLVKR